MDVQLLRMKQVNERTGLSRGGVTSLIEKGTFPMPIKITQKSIAFIKSEIDEWIDQQIKLSRTA